MRSVLPGAIRAAGAAAGLVGLVLAVASLPGRTPGEHPEPEVNVERNDDSAPDDPAVAVFAGGCFWCMEKPFDVMDGVASTTSGYAGGHVEDPTYEQVSSGSTGHTEAMRVRYDPETVAYEELLHVFWRNVDPFDAEGQFCDRGSQYRPAIFYADEEQARLARESKAALEERFDREIATEIVPLDEFYPAEDYHQNYYQEHSLRYRYYRLSCGRDRRLKEVWGEEAGGH